RGVGAAGGDEQERSLRGQDRERGLRGGQLRQQLGLEPAAHIADVERRERPGAGGAAEGEDEMVDLAEVGDEAVERGAVCGVEALAARALTEAVERGAQPLRVAAGDRDASAGVERGLRRREADPRRAAEDDDV